MKHLIQMLRTRINPQSSNIIYISNKKVHLDDYMKLHSLKHLWKKDSYGNYVHLKTGEKIRYLNKGCNLIGIDLKGYVIDPRCLGVDS